MRGALQDIIVLELASYLTGPYASMLLADLGAEVIKVEERSAGDPFRGWAEKGYDSTFCSVNRNKKSITLNLKAEEGRKIFLKLVQRADVLIENFRPRVVQEFGLDYETVCKYNPQIVYCSISGFGQEGPYRDWPGYDTIGQAMGGLLSLITDLENPTPVGVSLSDHITGIFACYGILAALYARERIGQGQKIETSLLQATASFVQEGAARYFATGVVPNRETRVQTAQVYAFTAKDGLPFVVHLSSPPKFWDGLTQAIERPELRNNPKFHDREARIRHYQTLHQILTEIFATRSRKEWMERLRKQDVPCAPLYTLDEVFEDPQVRYLGMPVKLSHPKMGLIRLSGSPIQLSRTPVKYRLAPPTLGEHNEEILKGLGYDDDTIERWRQQEII
ncbi:MAG: CaiB/BaiF CoA transferase family protein [Thermodesulfobacteriota bacterium]